MSLNTQMKALKHAVEAGALPSVVGAFRRAEMALRQSGILERAICAATKTGNLLRDPNHRVLKNAAAQWGALRPKFVAVKAADQLDLRTLHRLRERWSANALASSIRFVPYCFERARGGPLPWLK